MQQQLRSVAHKNISYTVDHAVSGFTWHSPSSDRLQRLLREFSHRARDWLANPVAQLRATLATDRASLRTKKRQRANSA